MPQAEEGGLMRMWKQFVQIHGPQKAIPNIDSRLPRVGRSQSRTVHQVGLDYSLELLALLRLLLLLLLRLLLLQHRHLTVRGHLGYVGGHSR